MEVLTIKSPLLEGREIFVPRIFQDHFFANPGLVNNICESNHVLIYFVQNKIKIESSNPKEILDVANIIKTIIFNIYNVYLIEIVIDLPTINFGIDEELIFDTNPDLVDIALTNSDRPKIIISGPRKEVKLIEKKIRSHVRKVHKATVKTKIYHVYFKPHLSVLFINKSKIFSEIQITTGTKIVVPTNLENSFLPITVNGKQSDAKIAKKRIINKIKNCVVRYLFLNENYHQPFYWNREELLRKIENKSTVVSILFLKQLVTIIGEIKNVDNAVKLIREYVGQLTQFVQEDIPIKSIFHSAISQRNLRRRIKNRFFALIFTFPDPDSSRNDLIRVCGSVEDVRKTKKEILRIGNLLEQVEIPVESNSMEFFRIEEINKMKRVARKNNTQITFSRPRADRNTSILIFGQKKDVEHVKTELQEMLRQIYTEKYVFVDLGLKDSLSYRGFLFKKINFECGNISLECTKVANRLAVTVSGDRGVGKAVQILRRASSNFEKTVLDEKVPIDPRIVEIELFTNQISYFQKKFEVRIRITNKAAYIRGCPENIFNCKFYLARLQENMLKEYTYKKKELNNGKRHVNTPKTAGKGSKGRSSLHLSNYEDISFCKNIKKKEKMLWQRPLETNKKFANCSLNSVMFIR